MKLGTKTALGIDISNGRINLALLKKTKSGVKLLKAASGTFPHQAIHNGNIEDATALAKAIKKLMAKNKIHTCDTALSLVANPALAQLIDLPKPLPSNVRQFVLNEVKHYAVLPINNSMVDYCGIRSSGRPRKKRALIVAIERQKITEVTETLSREGLNIKAVEPAWIAYIRACYAKKIANNIDKNLLFVAIENDTAIFCLFRNQTLDFIRTKHLDADKHEPDKYCRWLTEQIDTIIQFYELQCPDKCDKWEVTLAANTCDDSMQKNIELLCSGFKPLELKFRTLKDAYLDTPVADTDIDNKPSAVAVGLAMKLLNITDCNPNINLLPQKIEQIKSERKQRRVIANVAAVAVLLMLLSIGFFSYKVDKLNTRKEAKKQAHAGQSMQELLDERMLLRKKIENVSDKFEEVNTVLDRSSFLMWAQILNDISLSTPKTLRITKLLCKDNSKLSLQGKAASYEAVHLFVDMLNKCKNIESASLSGTKHEGRPDGLKSYSIDCSLIE